MYLIAYHVTLSLHRPFAFIFPTDGGTPAGVQVLRDRSAAAGVALAAMHPQWQECAARLKVERTRLSKESVPMLHRPSAAILQAGETEAAKLGMTTLLEDAGSKVVHLGVFTMPAVPTDIVIGPKGLRLVEPQQWFHLQQRSDISHEFLQAMLAPTDKMHQFGVLLSGPNGTGKSAIGVEAAMSAFARGLVCIYIPTASAWVAAAKAGNGDGFLLERLLRQNADLIADQPALREALAPALVLGPAAIRKMDAKPAGEVMDSLRDVLTTKPACNIGIVVDEVQTISFCIRDGMPEPATTPPRIGAEYFKDWYNWDNRNAVFVRMDIASSHGARELKLPSGEEHRLRVIKPWTADVVHAATTAAGSPLAFPKAYESARKRIIFTAGGIPRSLFQGKQLLKLTIAAGSTLSSATSKVEHDLRVAMEENCERWFKGLSAEDKANASNSMLRLVRGEVSWSRVKGLYDDGLVARCGDGFNVKPVSAVASSVIMGVLAGHYLEAVLKPLGHFAPGAERGFALELQVIACLAVIGSRSLPAKMLMGDEAAPNVSVRVDERLPFDDIDDIVLHDALSRLYVPTSKSFSCDAITVPSSAAAATEPIVVWETSVTTPRDSDRVNKVQKWFGAAGIVTLLRAAHPLRPIVCALCWPKGLGVAGPTATKHAALTDAAAAASINSAEVRVSVVDIKGLQKLGVRV